MGSVASPGRGSSKAAHMLLLRSNWTTWREGSGGGRKRGGGSRPYPPLPPLLGAAGHREPHSALWGDLPRRGRTHRPGLGASSRSCPPCTGWTGAAAASLTAGPRDALSPPGGQGSPRPGAPASVPHAPGCSSPHHSDRAGLPGAEGCGPRQMGCSPPSLPSAPASWAPSGPATPRSAAAACLGAGGVGGRWEPALDPAPDPGLQDADPRKTRLDTDRDSGLDPPLWDRLGLEGLHPRP